MENAKQWYLSKGVIGSLVAMAAGIYASISGGTAPAAEDQGTATELIVGIVTAVSGLIALIGRLAANSKVKL